VNFTAKEDYGLRAVLDLAAHAGAGPVQTREIAQRQHIPEQFLEQLLAALRRAEVVRSTRGAGGGYGLAASPGPDHGRPRFARPFRPARADRTAGAPE
jgi:Rrf2 family protein